MVGELSRAAVAFVLACAAFFPYSLARNIRLGYDFLVYYTAGQGEITPAYVYSHHTAFAWWPLSQIPFAAAYAIFYFATVAAVLLLFRRLGRGPWPLLSLGTGVLALWSTSCILRDGNVGGLLALAVTTPVGAVLASCFKPYLLGFVVLHAAVYCSRKSGRSHEVSAGQA